MIPEVPLSPDQIILVGLLASAGTFALKMLAQWSGYNPGRATLTLALYAVSLVLGGLWTGVYLPTETDPVAWITQFLTMAMPVLGMATAIYNLLYEKVVQPASRRILGSRFR